MVLQQRYISAEKFLEIAQQPEYEDRLVELVEGEIVEMSKPTGQHGIITFRLSFKIANFVFENKLGEVVAAETGFIIERNPDGRDTVLSLIHI